MTGVVHAIGGRLDHVPGRRFDAADDALDRRERAQPVRHVRELWTGDAGEEIFRAAGETSHLVRHVAPMTRTRS